MAKLTSSRERPLELRTTRARASRQPQRLVGGLLLCLVMLLASSPLLVRASAAEDRPFASTSPFNLAIRASPTLDPKSASMVARAARSGQVHANLVEYGIPIYTATASTSRYKVSCDLASSWGACPLSEGTRRIPTGAVPNVGDDHVLTVVDTSTGLSDEYWRARPSSSGWATAYGAVNSLSGSGWGGSSTGAGASRLAGVVRVSEIQTGLIPHALVLQSDNVCAGTVRPPALKTDGDSTRSDCIPEGARLQLDPALDVSALPGLTKAERMVARTMQVYGGYLIDRAGTSLSVSFERAPDATPSSPGAVYRSAGLDWDYDGMSAVPWSRLRVLKSWNG